MDGEVAEVQGFIDWAVDKIGLTTKVELIEFIIIVLLLIALIASKRRNGS